MINAEQLVQDVINGDENPQVARIAITNELTRLSNELTRLSNETKRFSKCLMEVDSVYFDELAHNVNSDKFYILNTKPKTK